MVLQAYNQVRTGFSLCRAGECKQSVPASEMELRERELRLWQILTPPGSLWPTTAACLKRHFASPHHLNFAAGCSDT